MLEMTARVCAPPSRLIKPFGLPSVARPRRSRRSPPDGAALACSRISGQPRSMALRGTMIMESLLSGVVLEGVELHVTRIARGDFGDVDAGQPLAWTVIDFEAAEADADRLHAGAKTRFGTAPGIATFVATRRRSSYSPAGLSGTSATMLPDATRW